MNKQKGVQAAKSSRCIRTAIAFTCLQDGQQIDASLAYLETSMAIL